MRLNNLRTIPLLLALLLLGACTATNTATNAVCPAPTGVALQVLGSGGPIADDGRASSGYIVWVDGKSRVLIDAGGGTFLRFGEAGARFDELDFVGLSHFHADHSADFPTLLKSGFFSERRRSLALAGPDAGGPFPGLQQYLNAQLDPQTGAYRYLSGYLNGERGLVKLDTQEIAATGSEPRLVYENPAEQLSVEALHVPHGIVPALSFRVRVGDTVLVFASDQNGGSPTFVDFAAAADVLVMHMPIPEEASGGITQLHATPGVIGEIAAAAEVDTLLLSHFMARSLRNLNQNVAVVRRAYNGTTVIADDLSCIAIAPTRLR